jgi:O-antigen/teichoic acid export membrane protein
MVPGTAVQGLMRFRHLILSGVVGPIALLALTVLLLRRLQLLGYVLALIGSGLAGLAYLAWAVREYIRPGIVSVSYREHWPKIRRYAINTGTLALFMGMAAMVEPWAVRNFTPPMDSAGFYMAFMFGQIPLYLSSAFLPFLFSLISERHERGRQTGSLLGQSVAVMAAVGVPLAVLFALFGGQLLDLRPSWSQYAAYAPLLWKVSLVSTLQGITLAYASHESACYRFGYVKFFLPVLAIEMVVLYGCMGWGFFQPHLSHSVWQAVDRLIGPRLDFAVWTMMGTLALLMLPVIWRFKRRAS